MGVQRIVLKHHCDVALRRLEAVDDSPINPDLSERNFFEARDHAQQGALAAARGPDDRDEFAVGNLHVETRDDLNSPGTAAVGFLDRTKRERPHLNQCSFFSIHQTANKPFLHQQDNRRWRQGR